MIIKPKRKQTKHSFALQWRGRNNPSLDILLNRRCAVDCRLVSELPFSFQLLSFSHRKINLLLLLCSVWQWQFAALEGQKIRKTVPSKIAIIHYAKLLSLSISTYRKSTCAFMLGWSKLLWKTIMVSVNCIVSLIMNAKAVVLDRFLCIQITHRQTPSCLRCR